MIRILSALTVLCVAPATAQNAACGPLEAVLEGLAMNFAESIRVDALMANGDLLIITASDAGGWTALSVTPDMTACVVAYGHGFGVTPRGIAG